MRRELPLAITFVVGIVAVLAVYTGQAQAVRGMDQWFVTSTAFAVFLGAISQVSHHLRIVRGKRPNWQYSIVLLAALVVWTGVGIWDKPGGARYGYLFQTFVVPLGATVGSLLAFYIGSAAYRAFRARNMDAAILLISGMIVMLGKAPIGEVISPWFSTATSWIMDVPNTAVMRGINLGVFVGTMAQAVKILLGIERSHLGSSSK
jgi:hypothetical protein